MSGHRAIRHGYNSAPIDPTARARPSRCFSPLGQEYDLSCNILSPAPLRMPPVGNPAPGIGLRETSVLLRDFSTMRQVALLCSSLLSTQIGSSLGNPSAGLGKCLIEAAVPGHRLLVIHGVF